MEFSRFVAALAPASALVDVEMLRSSFNRLDVGEPMWLVREDPTGHRRVSYSNGQKNDLDDLGVLQF